MPKTTMDLSELPAKRDLGCVLRGIAEAVLQLVMDFERRAIDPVDQSWRGSMWKA
ncbi:MAG: hypothetical protein ACXIUV_03890 [Alkalilacustris sp.]